MADNDRGQPANREDEADDVRSRFPDAENDPRLRTPREELPEFPNVQFDRPAPRRAEGNGGKEGWFSSDLRSMGTAGTIGTTLVASIAIGTLLGWLVDRYLLHAETQWGLIVGFLFGTASGFINMIRIANDLNRDDTKR